MSESWKRPKLKISKTKSEWIWDGVGYVSFLGTLIFLIAIWKELPLAIPAHFNAAGEITRWGSKRELLILPVIGMFMTLFTQILEKYPESHNYPKRFNESNAAQFYLHSRKMVNRIKNMCMLIFSFILFEQVSIALGWWGGSGVWMLPIILIIVFFPIIVGLIQQRKIK